MNQLLKSFNEMRQQIPDAVLLFRTGDFYESYCDDARFISKFLGITLTNIVDESNQNNIERAGFPHHALDMYLPKIIRAGRRVAICDQIRKIETR